MPDSPPGKSLLRVLTVLAIALLFANVVLNDLERGPERHQLAQIGMFAARKVAREEAADAGAFAEARRLTAQLIEGAADYQQSSAWRKKWALATLERIAQRRKDILALLIRSNPPTFLEVLLPEHVRRALPAEVLRHLEAPVVMEGALVISHRDDFANLRRTDYHVVKTADGTFSLRAPAPLGDLAGGTKVRVRGWRLEREIFMADPGRDLEQLSTAGAEVLTNNAAGDQPTLVILAAFPDSRSAPWTVEAVRQLFFQDPTSVGTYFHEVSFGRTFVSGGVVGWYVLATPQTCELLPVIADAIRAVGSDVYFPWYHRIVVVTPPGSRCGGGYGTIGMVDVETPDGPVRASLAWIGGYGGDVLQTALRHELGHNLGLDQANDYFSVSAARSPE